jgi:HAE1 family hydrophobic/amphiphilic exporter-1
MPLPRDPHRIFALIGLGTAGQVNQASGHRAHGAARGPHAKSQQEVIGLPCASDLAAIFPARAPSPRPFRWSAPASRGEPLQFVLDRRQSSTRSAASRASCSRSSPPTPGLGRIDSDVQLDLPQLVFKSRTACASPPPTCPPADVALAVNMLTGGVDIAKFNDEPGDGQRYDIRVKAREPGEFTQAKPTCRRSSSAASDGKMVRLDSVARFRREARVPP